MHKKNDHNLRTLATRIPMTQEIEVCSEGDGVLYKGTLRGIISKNDLLERYVWTISASAKRPGVVIIDVY